MLDAEPYPIGIDGDPPAPTKPETPEPDVEVQERQGALPENAQLNDNLREDLRDVITSPKGRFPTSAVEITQSYTNYPYRAMGRVFFLKDGSGRACSAAVSASENRSVVWTAGVCVAEQGNEDWHERWVFVPAYEGGEAPLDRWAARVKTTFVGWYAGGDRNYDLGAVVVEQRDQRSIAGLTGSLGWMFNAPRSQDFQKFGDPGSGNRFSGQKLWTCDEPYAGGEGVGSNTGPRTSTMTCDYTAGASGGPWVVNFENCPGCYVNSVKSWWWKTIHPHVAQQWTGPYHGKAAHRPLQFAEGF